MLAWRRSADLLVDVGGYPELDPAGEFAIRVVRASNWDEPIFEARTGDLRGLIEALERAVGVAERG